MCVCVGLYVSDEIWFKEVLRFLFSIDQQHQSVEHPWSFKINLIEVNSQVYMFTQWHFLTQLESFRITKLSKHYRFLIFHRLTSDIFYHLSLLPIPTQIKASLLRHKTEQNRNSPLKCSQPSGNKQASGKSKCPSFSEDIFNLQINDHPQLIVMFPSCLATERYTQLHTKRENCHLKINENTVNRQLNILNAKIKVNFLYPMIS